MKAIKNKIVVGAITCVGIISLFNSATAQDMPHYSLYMLHQPFVNVAASGSYDGIYGGLIVNNQMMGFTGAPVVGTLDIGGPIGNTNLVLSGQLSQEKIGISNKTNFALSAAYRVQLDMKNYLSFGVSFGGKYVNSDFSQLNNIGGDPTFSNRINYVSPTIRVGAYYFRNNLYVGAGVNNILSDDLNNTNLGRVREVRADAKQMHWFVHAGYQVNFGKNWKFQPSVLMKHINGAPFQLDVNAHFLANDRIGFGASYRTTGTAIILVDYTFRKGVTLGYSGNFSINNKTKSSFMGHEIFLGFRLKGSKNKNQKLIGVDVPRF
jgi:type IX secretion system PorP/SprF family membrane protein